MMFRIFKTLLIIFLFNCCISNIYCDKSEPDVLKNDDFSISVIKNITSADKNVQIYAAGIQTKKEFIHTYDIVHDSKTGHWAHVIVKPANETRHYSKDDIYQKGLIYKNEPINFTEIYTKEHQIAKFQEQLGDKQLVDKYFADDNYLVKGQLVSKDDLFNVSYRKSVYFYENVVPIWRSINEGNWKIVDETILTTADYHGKNLEVYTLTVDGFRINNINVTLGQTSSSHKSVDIPRILVKIMVGPGESEGMVFHVANDPFMTMEKMQKIITSRLCPLTTESICTDLFSAVNQPKNGLIYCCKLEQSSYGSFIWSGFKLF